MIFVEENLRITIILIIRVSSFSFLMFYPKFMMYQTLSCFEFVDLGFWLYFGHGSFI